MNLQSIRGRAGLACLAFSMIVGVRYSVALAQQPPTETAQRVADREIRESVLRGHIRFLAHDLLEGRGPGTRGDHITQQYIAAAFERAGLEPAAPDGGWFQPVPLIGVTTHAPETLTLRHGDNAMELRRHDDYVLNAGVPQESVELTDGELVFVGYGIVAPEYDWDDFKGADLRGKVLVVMNNDPSDDPELFAGTRRLYYGRWDYKYDMAARQGAAGAIIIHTTESAGYPYQVVQTSWSGEESELRGKQGPRLKVRGWFTEDAAKQAVKFGGHDLEALRKSAESRDFKPVPLGVRLSVRLTCDVREQDTANVLGVLRGSDPSRSDEMVVYMAHHDHIGLAAERDERGDNIYNGAVDNASGVASLLAMAEAYSRLPEPPPRSILFAAVGAEEQGLLGSAYFAQHPPVPAGKLAAVLNIDGVNTLGPTRDVNLIGGGKSSLDAIVKGIAEWQRRVVTPDHFPDRGYYYRSDQFSLAKIGVPGVYLHSGIHVVGKPEGWGREQREKWIATKYHQPSDEYDESWDLRGAVEDQKLMFYVGLEVANDREMPSWSAGDEFEAARKEALDAVRD